LVNIKHLYQDAWCNDKDEEFSISLCPILNAYSHEKSVVWKSAFW